MTPNITDWLNEKLTKGIAELLGIYYAKGITGSDVYINEHYPISVDYCNNYNDLIPLMIKHDVLYQLSKLANQREMAECLYMILLAKSKEQE